SEDGGVRAGDSSGQPVSLRLGARVVRGRDGAGSGGHAERAGDGRPVPRGRGGGVPPSGGGWVLLADAGRDAGAAGLPDGRAGPDDRREGIVSRAPGFRGLRFFDRTDGRGDVLEVESPVNTPGAAAFFCVNNSGGLYLTRAQVLRLRE